MEAVSVYKMRVRPEGIDLPGEVVDSENEMNLV